MKIKKINYYFDGGQEYFPLHSSLDKQSVNRGHIGAEHDEHNIYFRIPCHRKAPINIPIRIPVINPFMTGFIHEAEGQF
jgi:hypothetical protein